MKCDKLFKEAFEGIEFRYKLDDTLEGLGNQKFTAKQLEGYLLGKGVSPKEIKQSGIFKGFEDRPSHKFSINNPTGVIKVSHYTADKEHFANNLVDDSGKDIGVLGTRGLYVDITDNTWGKDTDYWFGSGLEKVDLEFEIKKPLILTVDNYSKYEKIFNAINNINWREPNAKDIQNKLYENFKGYDAIVIPENNKIPDEFLSVPQMVVLHPTKQIVQQNRAIPASEWLSKSGSQRIKYEDTHEYANITLGMKGSYKGSEDPINNYKATLSKLPVPEKNAPDTPHFRTQMFADPITGNELDTQQSSLLGWRRTHIDEINGKKTLVLNEFQSDWAQTERAGRGTFESNAKTKLIFSTEDERDLAMLKAQDLGASEEEINRIGNAPISSQGHSIVADFPMSEVKHHQFQIVGAIDEALKQGIDTVAIPIQRENELAGSAGVTKFYENLNTKILPDIRKKLEKQGLRIKVDKKPYKVGTNIVDPKQLSEWENIDNDFYNTNSEKLLKAIQDIQNSEWFDAFYNSEHYPYTMPIDVALTKNSTDILLSDLLFGLRQFNGFNPTNDLWTLTIEEVPNGKVKWDVYSVLTALGLSSYVNNNEEQ